MGQSPIQILLLETLRFSVEGASVSVMILSFPRMYPLTQYCELLPLTCKAFLFHSLSVRQAPCLHSMGCPFILFWLHVSS